MSRFLDAMRNKGNLAETDDNFRFYKGKIVDAGDVLAPRDKVNPAEDLSIQPLSTDGEPSILPLSDRPKPVGPTEPASYAEQPPRSAAGEQGRSGRTVAAQAVDDNGNASVGAATNTNDEDADDRPPVNKSAFSVRNLDPLFYLIVGTAAVGLFTCLYALITQNDAYFEREYQQLQKESAALQARLAASTKLEAALTAAASAQKSISVETATALKPDASVSQQAVVPQPVLRPVPPIAEKRSAEIVTSEVNPEPPVAEQVFVAEQNSAEFAIASASEAALLSLRQEVENLRIAMTRQENKIVRLEQDNLELTSILDNSKTGLKPVARSATQPAPAVVQSAPEKAPPEKAPPETMNAGRQAPITSRTDLPAAVIDRRVLATPVGGSETETTELVQQGYLAYQARDFTAANDFYSRALGLDPYDRDANLGVAATAQQIGDYKLAEDRYRHLLTLNPADEVAFSALLNLSNFSGQGSIIEFELTQHIEYVENPQKLYAILGNYYSQQERWLNAESAYSIALRDRADNPDYLFNYAVALDNIGRTARAAEYYSQALSGIENAAYSFDARAARQRLQSLSADTQ